MKTVDEAYAAGASDGRQGLGPIPPRSGPPGSHAHRLYTAYMDSYRDNIVARVGVPERRKKNPACARVRPGAPCAGGDDLAAATKLYKAFREAPVRHTRRITVMAPKGKALARMGVCEFIGYMTTHQGRPALYVHHFAPGSRPAMYAGTRRNELYLVGGRFHVTGRGITDLNVRGREIDYTPRYDVNPRRRRR